MRQRIYIMAAIAILGGVAACDAPQKKSDVWKTYDTRHPVPQDSSVPDGYARQYDQYIDNDSYYQAPDCTVMDSPACGE